MLSNKVWPTSAFHLGSHTISQPLTQRPLQLIKIVSHHDDASLTQEKLNRFEAPLPASSAELQQNCARARVDGGRVVGPFAPPARATRNLEMGTFFCRIPQKSQPRARMVFVVATESRMLPPATSFSASVLKGVFIADRTLQRSPPTILPRSADSYRSPRELQLGLSIPAKHEPSKTDVGASCSLLAIILQMFW
jgi:hypothetical protein